MAYGDISAFLPGESAYRTPGAYTEAMRLEATKRATYLSQMDQFYAQLEESARQFDLGFEIEQERLSLEKERFGLEQQYFGLAQEQLAWEKEYGEAKLGLEGRQLDISEKWYTGQLELGEKELDVKSKTLQMSEKELEMSERLAERELGIAESAIDKSQDIASMFARTSLGTTTGGPVNVSYTGGDESLRVVSTPTQNWWEAVNW